MVDVQGQVPLFFKCLLSALGEDQSDIETPHTTRRIQIWILATGLGIVDR